MNSISNEESIARSPWDVKSWRNYPIKQDPAWPDKDELDRILCYLRNATGLVTAEEILNLRSQLADVALGKRFLLQGGDCAESFRDCNYKIISQKMTLLFHMSTILGHFMGKPCTVLARIAGQYGKPRSFDVDDDGVFNFRGDNINGIEPENRTPDAKRLLKGYEFSNETLQYCQQFLSDQLQKLEHSKPENWNVEFLNSSKFKDLCRNMLNNLISKEDNLSNKRELFISHEALILVYEEAFTRIVKDKFFNFSAHFLWIGDRTRQLDHAHLEFIRGLENPIGIKVGPSMDANELVKVLKLVCPERDEAPGRISLITRYGVDKVESILPKHIQAVQSICYKVAWITDPCHGNTTTTKAGYKTRNLENIIEEIKLTAKVHKRFGSFLGGVHLEMTGEDVRECNLEESEDPGQEYKTYCDPRLNYDQAMELAFRICDFF